MSISLCTEVEGLGGRVHLGGLRPPPGLNAPCLWCTTEQSVVQDYDSLEPAPPVPQVRDTPPGDAGATASGALGERCVGGGGGCRTGSPIESKVAWRRGPGRRGPCALHAAHCAMCVVGGGALCVVLCALCVVLCRALCTAVGAVRAAHCGALCGAFCGALCAAPSGALCAASCGALCAASCGALCAASCGALCVALCGALCAVLCAGSACAPSWCCALCVAHCAASAPWCCALSAVPSGPAPTRTDVPALWEGGGISIAMGAGSPTPLCQHGSRNAAENILQSRGGSPLWGRGGEGHLLLPVAAGSLCTHIRTRAPRRGRARVPAGPAAAAPASGGVVSASPAPASLRTPVWPPQPCQEHTCPRLAGRRCQHPPARGSHKRPSTRVLTG